MKKQWRTVMAWNTRRILIEVIQGTSDDALALATRLGGKLKHKSDDSRWQTWVGKADVEMGFDVAAIRRTAQLPDRIAGQPAHHDECACEDCLQRDDEQPPIQQPAAGEPTIQSGECSFLGQLPKGPALGRFSAAERAELDDLKRKAFKAGEP